MRIGEQDLLLPVAGHIVFTTVAGQGWLAGPKPSLDASRNVARAGYAIKLSLECIGLLEMPVVRRIKNGLNITGRPTPAATTRGSCTICRHRRTRDVAMSSARNVAASSTADPALRVITATTPLIIRAGMS
jgi:hypothetical protein